MSAVILITATIVRLILETIFSKIFVEIRVIKIQNITLTDIMVTCQYAIRHVVFFKYFHIIVCKFPLFFFKCSIYNIPRVKDILRSEEHTSELQSRGHLVCRLLLEKKN